MKCQLWSSCKNWKIWLTLLGFLLFCHISFNLSLRKRSVFARKIDLGTNVEYSVDTATGGQSIVVSNISGFDTNGTFNNVLNTPITETRNTLQPCPQKPTYLGKFDVGQNIIYDPCLPNYMNYSNSYL